MTEQVKQIVKDFILKEFLPGERPEALTDSTPLVSGGILDSLATLKLVAFIEEQYGITLSPHEYNVDYLNTITDVASLVESKRKAMKR